mmetsp:Transcript_119053/g.297053  ORF Transcript_119053/g.297053 Transcript_119053/m.297053 type:complete len:500 (+) Transcript_119053:77-1576(+)
MAVPAAVPALPSPGFSTVAAAKGSAPPTRVAGTRRRFDAAAARAAAEEKRRSRLKISDVTEQRILKVGVRSLAEKLVHQEDLHRQLPRKPDGGTRLLRHSFFERLLSGELEFRASVANDVSAAQSDLRLLQLEHLLSLRSRTLDFATQSATHNAHNAFLNSMDKLLFERLARRLLADEEVPLPDPGPLFSLGFRAAVVLGARLELLGAPLSSPSSPSSVASRRASGLSTDGGSGPAIASALADQEEKGVPQCWVLPLQGDHQWPDGVDRTALLFTDTLRIRILEAAGAELNQATVAAVGPETKVAVIWDRSFGIGKDRMLHWEVSLMDPVSQDLAGEIAQAVKGSSSSRSGGGLGQDLANVLGQRRKSAASGVEAAAAAQATAAPAADPAAGTSEQSRKRSTLPGWMRKSATTHARAQAPPEDGRQEAPPEARGPKPFDVGSVRASSMEVAAQGLRSRGSQADRQVTCEVLARPGSSTLNHDERVRTFTCRLCDLCRVS